MRLFKGIVAFRGLPGVGVLLSQRFIIFLLFILLAIPLTAQAVGLTVDDIRTSGSGKKARIVLDLSRKTDFRVFLLGDPYRVVLDLPPADIKTFTSRQLPGNGLIKSYRSGLLDDGLMRIIFDLRQPATVENAFLIAKKGTAKDRLVIDTVQSSKNAFAAQTSRIVGSRNLTAGSAAPKKTAAATDYAARETRAVRQTTQPRKPAKPAVTAPKPQKVYTVVIDAGHGGEDPGAQAFGLREKDITLAVAKELRRQLEETGRYKVVLTRDKDFYIKLHERVDISRSAKADLFVSIHADKVDRANTRGASIYTLSEKASDAETARLAEDENNAGFVAGVDLSQESQDVADILLDLAMREKMNESNLFARTITTSFKRKNVQLLPNSHRSAGFAVLKAPDVPSILIETGFISNPQEAKLLTSGQFQSNIASAILDGIDAYFRKIQAFQKP